MKKLTDQLIRTNNARARKDIRKWRTALGQAENIDNPKRILLYSLYDELMLDAHLTAQFQKRTLAVRSSQYSVFNIADGKTDTDKTALLIAPWFSQFLDLALESMYWGHSLIQIGEITNGQISQVSLINRRHVIPEKGIFLIRQTDNKGIPYRDDKKYMNNLLEVGDNYDLGLLNKSTPHVLFKRFAQSAWSEYCELFGMPFRIGKTNVKDPESLNRMEDMLIHQGVAKYAVIDDQENLEFIETAKSNGSIYQGLIDLSNAEISKLINGAVTGEASQGGSRSKEEVGERTGSLISEADKQFLEGYINYTLFPKLIELGYPLQNTAFRFEQAKDTNALWKITEGLLTHYQIDPEYITNTFGIPVKEKNNNQKPDQDDKTGKDEDKEKDEDENNEDNKDQNLNSDDPFFA